MRLEDIPLGGWFTFNGNRKYKVFKKSFPTVWYQTFYIVRQAWYNYNSSGRAWVYRIR